MLLSLGYYFWIFYPSSVTCSKRETDGSSALCWCKAEFITFSLESAMVKSYKQSTFCSLSCLFQISFFKTNGIKIFTGEEQLVIITRSNAPVAPAKTKMKCYKLAVHLLSAKGSKWLQFKSFLVFN